MVGAEYGQRLIAPGVAGRWNSAGKFALYAAESRSLTCLENLVHRSTESLMDNFVLLVIEIVSSIQVEQLNPEDLPAKWFLPDNYFPCQSIGDEWIKSKRSCLLKVPSAIIQQEFNFLINVEHEDFQHVKILQREKFLFDPRVIS